MNQKMLQQNPTSSPSPPTSTTPSRKHLHQVTHKTTTKIYYTLPPSLSNPQRKYKSSTIMDGIYEHLENGIVREVRKIWIIKFGMASKGVEKWFEEPFGNVRKMIQNPHRGFVRYWDFFHKETDSAFYLICDNFSTGIPLEMKQLYPCQLFNSISLQLLQAFQHLESLQIFTPDLIILVSDSTQKYPQVKILDIGLQRAFDTLTLEYNTYPDICINYPYCYIPNPRLVKLRQSYLQQHKNYLQNQSLHAAMSLKFYPWLYGLIMYNATASIVLQITRNQRYQVRMPVGEYSHTACPLSLCLFLREVEDEEYEANYRGIVGKVRKVLEGYDRIGCKQEGIQPDNVQGSDDEQKIDNFMQNNFEFFTDLSLPPLNPSYLHRSIPSYLKSIISLYKTHLFQPFTSRKTLSQFISLFHFPNISIGNTDNNFKETWMGEMMHQYSYQLLRKQGKKFEDQDNKIENDLNKKVKKFQNQRSYQVGGKIQSKETMRLFKQCSEAYGEAYKTKVKLSNVNKEVKVALATLQLNQQLIRIVTHPQILSLPSTSTLLTSQIQSALNIMLQISSYSKSIQALQQTLQSLPKNPLLTPQKKQILNHDQKITMKQMYDKLQKQKTEASYNVYELRKYVDNCYRVIEGILAGVMELGLEKERRCRTRDMELEKIEEEPMEMEMEMQEGQKKLDSYTKSQEQELPIKDELWLFALLKHIKKQKRHIILEQKDTKQKTPLINAELTPHIENSLKQMCQKLYLNLFPVPNSGPINTTPNPYLNNKWYKLKNLAYKIIFCVMLVPEKFKGKNGGIPIYFVSVLKELLRYCQITELQLHQNQQMQERQKIKQKNKEIIMQKILTNLQYYIKEEVNKTMKKNSNPRDSTKDTVDTRETTNLKHQRQTSQ